MARGRYIWALVVAPALFAAAVLAMAAAAAENDDKGRVPMPSISRGNGEECVADTDFMRRNHMKMLLHQRDQTMYEGVRTKQYSLKECVACHAVPGPDARPVTAASPKHFCRACHDYAAVSIDCFECHASRPEVADELATLRAHDTAPAPLRRITWK